MIMREDDQYQEYQAEKDEFIHRTQQEAYLLWLNRFIAQGAPINLAISRAQELAAEWTNRPCNIRPVTQDEIDF